MEQEIIDLYGRSPYASRLDTVGYRLICIGVKGGESKATSALRQLGRTESQTILLVVDAMRETSRKLGTDRTAVCYVQSAGAWGIVIREHTGMAWYRKRLTDPSMELPSLKFLDLTDHVRGKLLPKPGDG